MKIAVLLVSAACGDNAAATAPPIDTAPAACTAAFSGALIASLASPANCARVRLDRGHRLLDFTIPVAAIFTSLDVSFDLGASTATGLYTSETVKTWSAS